MSIVTFTAKSHLKEGMKVESTSRNFKMLLDEPESLGGTDEGMNPVEAVLCALGSCQCIMARAMAAKMRVDLIDFWVELEGDLDPEGFKGSEEVRPGFQNVRANFHIKADASDEKINKLIKNIERFCPVGDTLEHGVSLSANYIIEK